jgi:hypothetical protein
MDHPVEELRINVFKNKKLNAIRADWMDGQEFACQNRESNLLSASGLSSDSMATVFQKAEKVFEKTYGIDGDVYYYDLLVGYESLTTSDSFEIFMNIPDSYSERALTLSTAISYKKIKAYFKALVLLNSKEAFLISSSRIDYGNIDECEGLARKIKEISNSSYKEKSLLNDSKDDASFNQPEIRPDKKEIIDLEIFFSVLQSFFTVEEFSSVDPVVIYILREIYGEKIVIELLEKIIEVVPRVPFDELMELLKDWENMREYPLEWGVTLME